MQTASVSKQSFAGFPSNFSILSRNVVKSADVLLEHFSHLLSNLMIPDGRWLCTAMHLFTPPSQHLITKQRLEWI